MHTNKEGLTWKDGVDPTDWRASTAERLLISALCFVESKSIREWAGNGHNRPILVKIAEEAIAKNGPTADPVRFAAYITCSAIGM